VVRADRAFSEETAAATIRMQARDQEHVITGPPAGDAGAELERHLDDIARGRKEPGEPRRSRR
jgi:hypothetical protein